MINRINSNISINNANRIYNTTNTKSDEVSNKSISDVLELTGNKGITSKTYDVMDLKMNMPKEIKELLDTFSDDIYRLEGELTIYDVSDFKDSFPFQLASDKVIGLKIGDDNSNYCYSMMLKTDSGSGSTRYNIYSTSGADNSVIKEPSMFKNSVMKGFMLGSEVMNKFKDINASIPDEFGLELDFSRSDKKVDFSVFNEVLDYTKDMVELKKKYGHINKEMSVESDEKKDKFELYKKYGLDKILESIINLKL